MGCARPQFHTLLTSGRPKQTASRRFCSHTVQAPAKPNPLRSQSPLADCVLLGLTLA